MAHFPEWQQRIYDRMAPVKPTGRLRLSVIEQAVRLKTAWHRAGFPQVDAWAEPTNRVDLDGNRIYELATNLLPGGLPPKPERMP